MNLIAMRILTAALASVGLCGACAVVGLPPDQTTAEAIAARHEREYTEYYEKALQPFFYEEVLSQCVQQSFNDKRPSSLVIGIDATGRVVKVYGDAQTRMERCLVPVVSIAGFPKPPVAPFFAHFDIAFERRR